jgi:hypothetical protein
VVFVDFFPPGDGMVGVFFVVEVGFLDEIFPPFYGVPSFFPADLFGVYFKIFPTFWLTSPSGFSSDFGAAFAALAADLLAAFFLPLAPPATLGAAGASADSVFFFKASLPFS